MKKVAMLVSVGLVLLGLGGCENKEKYDLKVGETTQKIYTDKKQIEKDALDVNKLLSAEEVERIFGKGVKEYQIEKEEAPQTSAVEKTMVDTVQVVNADGGEIVSNVYRADKKTNTMYLLNSYGDTKVEVVGNGRQYVDVIKTIAIENLREGDTYYVFSYLLKGEG